MGPVLRGCFLQRNYTLFIKRKTPGKKTAAAHPDGTLHGKGDVGLIGQLVKELDNIPIGACQAQGQVAVFLGCDCLAQVAFPGKNPGAFKVQRIIHALDGNGFLVWIKNPEVGQQVDMAQCHILDIQAHEVNLGRHGIDAAARREEKCKKNRSQCYEPTVPVPHVSHGKTPVEVIRGWIFMPTRLGRICSNILLM